MPWTPSPSDFSDLKRLMNSKTGDAKLSARLTLTWGILWSLEMGTRPEMIVDLLTLMQFELNRLRAEHGLLDP